MRVYRVFPYDPDADAHEPGGTLFAASSAANRLANPSLFSELYVSDSPVGAIAEAFGRLDVWSAMMLQRTGHPYALAAYDVVEDERICNLDNACRLLAYRLNPSDVVATERETTQAWAARIYEADQWIGISWWSRYDSRWQSMGIWDRASLAAIGTPEELSPTHPALVEAASVLPRQILA